MVLQFEIIEKISLFKDTFDLKVLANLIKMHNKMQYLNSN